MLRQEDKMHRRIIAILAVMAMIAGTAVIAAA